MAAAPETDFQTIARTISPLEIEGELPLSRLGAGAEAVILGVEGDGPECLRLRDLGLVRGTRIRTIKRAPLGDPVVYDLRGYRLCLRRSETDRVRVTRI